MKNLFLTLLLLTSTVFADEVIQKDKLKIGRASTATDKQVVFDVGDGTTNPAISVEKVSKKMKLSPDEIQVGSSNAASDKAITFNGSGKKITYKGATNILEHNMDKMSVGDGTNTNKEFIFDKGANSPKIRYNSATVKLEFSDNGTTYSEFAAGGGGGGLAQITTSAAVTMQVNKSYVVTLTGATRQNLTLPLTATLGDRIEILGQGNAKYYIKSNASAANQKILKGNYASNTSSSSAINLYQSDLTYSTAELVYTAAGTWTISDFISGDTIGDYNFWGDGSDGAFSSVANTSLPSTLDGDCIIKQYTDFTLNTGHTFTMTNRARCMVIYVSGNATINGTFSGSARGPFIDPSATSSSDGNAVTANGIIFRRKKTAGGAGATNSATNLLFGAGNALKNAEDNQRVLDATNTGTLYTWNKVGGAAGGNVQCNADQFFTGGNGGTGVGSAGGGGGGGCFGSGASHSVVSGGGAAATVWAGGSGGGGVSKRSPGGGTTTAGAGGNFAGAGGAANDAGGSGGASKTGGGAGNPGGAGISGGTNGVDGTGGSIALIVRGTITVGATGFIQSVGSNGGSGVDAGGGAGGGASGGGNILILSGGTYTNSGTVTAAGGIGGTSPANPSSLGGNGGAGSIQQAVIDL